MGREFLWHWSWMEPIVMMFVCGVATLDGLMISRPEPTSEQPQHLCLDAAYDSTAVYKEVVARHYQPHVRSPGEEKREKEITPGYRARRWVVEKTQSQYP